jgi:hypothetical protein
VGGGVLTLDGQQCKLASFFGNNLLEPGHVGHLHAGQFDENQPERVLQRILVFFGNSRALQWDLRVPQ